MPLNILWSHILLFFLNLQMFSKILLLLLQSIVIFICRTYFTVIRIKFLFYYGRKEFQIFWQTKIIVISE